MAKELIDQASEYVEEIETRDFIELYLEHEQAQRRAEKCRCPQCRKYAKSTRVRLEMEIRRLDTNRWHPDHEEDYIAQFALLQLSNKNK
ncbi:MAG: hypothetical protein N3A54_06055 [Patescibacteria group bacterium]|nr:hypothetical protein [Patescibacteria group bacterium]